MVTALYVLKPATGELKSILFNLSIFSHNSRSISCGSNFGFCNVQKFIKFFFYFDKTTRCSTYGMIPLKCTYNKLDKKKDTHCVLHTGGILVYKILTLIDRCLPRLWLKKFFNRFTHQSKSSNEWKSSLRALRIRRTEA